MIRRHAMKLAASFSLSSFGLSLGGCRAGRSASGLVIRLSKDSSELALVPTLHALPEPLGLPTIVANALRRSTLALFEVDLTDNSLVELRRTCLQSLIERTPRTRINEGQRDKLRRFLEASPLRKLATDDSVPEFWQVVAVASANSSGSERIEHGVDVQLTQHARSLGVDVRFLESSCDAADAQARVLQRKVDTALLSEMIDSLESSHSKKHYEALTAAWIEGRAEIASQAYKALEDLGPLQYALHQSTILERNKLHLIRVKSHLANHKKILVATGMDHILMPGGIVSDLLSEGWDLVT